MKKKEKILLNEISKYFVNYYFQLKFINDTINYCFSYFQSKRYEVLEEWTLGSRVSQNVFQIKSVNGGRGAPSFEILCH